MSTERNHLITYIGAVLVVIGTFAPLATIPIIGDISYYDVNNPAVFLLILCAIAGPALVFMKKEALTFVAPLGVWLVLLWPMIQGSMQSEDTGLMSKLTKAATDPLQDFAADLFTNIADFSWGGYVFLIGIIALTAGGVMTTLAARK